MAMVMTSMMSEESGDDHTVVGVNPSRRNASLASSNGAPGSLSDMGGGGEGGGGGGGAVGTNFFSGTGAGALALFGGGGDGGGGADEGGGASRRADILEEDRRTRRWQVERTAARLNRVSWYVSDKKKARSFYWMKNNQE